MKTINIQDRWLKDLLPEGFLYPSSTVISGSGGTGKPLVEFAFVASWLKSGGSIIGIPLQYPTMDFVNTTLKKLYNIDYKEYRNNITMIQLDPKISNCERVNDHLIKANLLKPDVWNQAIEKACQMIHQGDPGIMVFGSALNLLLFSPTYQEKVIKHIEDVLKNDKSKTYIFSVSTSMFSDKIKRWENATDNLMYTRMENPMKLFFKISRMKQIHFVEEEVNVPITKETLLEIKGIAEATRKKTIPEIMKI